MKVNLKPDPSATYGRIARFAGILMIASGALGFLGGISDRDLLRAIAALLAPIVPNTACGFFVAGVALCLVVGRPVTLPRLSVAKFCAMSVSLLGFLTVCEYLGGWELGIDRVFLPRGLAHGPYAGRPSVLSAANFLLLGAALFLMDSKARRGRALADILILAANSISLLALIGHLCNVPLFYGWLPAQAWSGMSPQSLFLFLMFGAGLLCARPERGLMALLISGTAGGLLARRLILAPVLIPLFTGLINMAGQRSGNYNPDLSGWMFSFANVFIFTAIIWWNARAVHRSESVRLEAEERLHRLNEELENRVLNRTAELSNALRELQQNEEKIRGLNSSLEQRVLARTEQLEEAVKELETFSYSVSHDLRAPLRHVDGFAQLLIEDYSGALDDKGKRHLRTISNSAREMATLIDALLNFSRAGRSGMHLTPVDMAELVAVTVQELSTETVGRAIEWDIGPLPVITGDRALLRQMWVNLLSNAVKYSRRRNPATIAVDCSEKDDEWHFSVRDNGVGFDMRHAGKLFGVFQRLHRADEFEGTGIGLANVRRTIIRHGGRIWAEGKPDEGAVFHFVLPKVAENPKSATTP